MEATYRQKLEHMKTLQIEEKEKLRATIIHDAEKKVEDAAAANKASTETALESLENEFVEQIHSLEYDLGWNKKQKKQVELEMETLKSINSDYQEKNRKLTALVDSIQKHSSFVLLRCVSQSISLKNSLNYTFESKLEKMEEKLKHSKDREDKRTQNLEEEIEVLTKQITSYKDRDKVVNDILVNKNRDSLLQHKLKGKEISIKLEKVLTKRKNLESDREKVETIMKDMENKVRHVENQILEHSQTSAIQEGRINISHARKKRRLDEE